MNHTIDECYSNHGYPQSYKQKKNYNNNNQERGNQHKGNQQMCNFSAKNGEFECIKHDTKEENMSFIMEQMKKLLKLVEEP